MAFEQRLSKFAQDLAAQVVREFRDAVEKGINEVQTGLSNGNGRAKPNALKGRKLTRDMSCRWPDCKNRSLGPRFGYFCAEHKDKPKKLRDNARAKWALEHRKT